MINSVRIVLAVVFASFASRVIAQSDLTSASQVCVSATVPEILARNALVEILNSCDSSLSAVAIEIVSPDKTTQSGVVTDFLGSDELPDSMLAGSSTIDRAAVGSLGSGRIRRQTVAANETTLAAGLGAVGAKVLAYVLANGVTWGDQEILNRIRAARSYRLASYERWLGALTEIRNRGAAPKALLLSLETAAETDRKYEKVSELTLEEGIRLSVSGDVQLMAKQLRTKTKAAESSAESADILDEYLRSRVTVYRKSLGR